MASIMQVVKAAVGAVKKSYQNVWIGSADRTKQGKKKAMKHFEGGCINRRIKSSSKKLQPRRMLEV